MKRDSTGQSPNRNSSSLSGQDATLNQEGANSLDTSADRPSMRLQRFRWLIPAYSELKCKLRFTSAEIGQFDQTLNFEIGGTRRRYQLHCRGVCTFPKISCEPRVVFPGKKKSREAPTDIVHKKFLLAENLFDFGPLLVGNNRERVREGKFPEYVETLTIQSGSPLDAEVSFCFLDESADRSEVCFYLDPPELTLKPHEIKTLKVSVAFITFSVLLLCGGFKFNWVTCYGTCFFEGICCEVPNYNFDVFVCPSVCL